MECLHGKTAYYNLLEGIYANAVAQQVGRHCVESCNGCQVGHPCQGQHDCLVMNENERWHLHQLEKDPDSTFVDSLMELHQNTENTMYAELFVSLEIRRQSRISS